MSAFDREVGEIMAELRSLRKEMEAMNARLDKVDARLGAHEDAAEKRQLEDAHTKGYRSALMWVGGASLTALSLVGGWLASYLPDVIQWWTRMR